MKSGLVGPSVNHQPGDIVDTDEGARWIAFGIAEPADAPDTPNTIETAALPDAKEVATRLRAKSTKPKVSK
ncbi:hypothetical protein [Sphingomonas sp. IC081]|uniref:hypothetical protein n=1 Tax=Sphingomonas sp. IC081 TaxID=304378 RepID=UPI00115B15B1|nr:hypothetical protein [Sphingomonas sp. IC081]QDK32677.1 hypothetical protein DM450_07750 [Sphingomonas sp. IC081]